MTQKRLERRAGRPSLFVHQVPELIDQSIEERGMHSGVTADPGRIVDHDVPEDRSDRERAARPALAPADARRESRDRGAVCGRHSAGLEDS